MLAEAAARLSKLKSTWPAHQRQLCRRPAGIGNVHDEDPALALNISPARCPALPLPPRAVVQLAGVLAGIVHQVGQRADASAAPPFRLFITSTLGTWATSVMGVKSRSGS